MRDYLAFSAQNLYNEVIDCYYSMCSEYISATSQPKTKAFSEILTAHQLDQDANTNRLDPTNQLAWKFLVLPEYHGSSEKIEAQSSYEQFYKKTNSGPN